MRTIGLALGGGGARGLAHALVLEALDELGCRPCVIAGTSMGAIMGALYASGVPGKAIRRSIQEHMIPRRPTLGDLFRRRSQFLKLARGVALERGPGGLVKADRFLNSLLAAVNKRTFEELGIPLLVIAADYWSGEEVVLESGELLPALKASTAIPGIFAPVSIGRRVLVDGSIVDLVPYEHILDRCDVTIAVNVAGARTPGKGKMPKVWEAILGALEIMQEVTLAERLKRSTPDLVVHPKIVDVPTLAFGQAARVLRQSAPAVREMKRAIAEMLAQP